MSIWRPLTCHVLGRGLSEDILSRIAKVAPSARVYLYDLSSVDYGAVRLLDHVAISTMDRLFFPEILHDTARLLYLDVDVMARSDVGELHDLALGDTVIAGRCSAAPDYNTGWALLAKKLVRHDRETSRKLILWAFSQGRVQFDTLNAGVLVMNLDALRRDAFTAKTLSMVEAFGFHDQDAINFYLRGAFTALPTEWNYVPDQDFCPDPKLVHWAGARKPWKTQFTAFRTEYRKL